MICYGTPLRSKIYKFKIHFTIFHSTILCLQSLPDNSYLPLLSLSFECLHHFYALNGHKKGHRKGHRNDGGTHEQR